jgi:H+/gluconate symporter-like permease
MDRSGLIGLLGVLLGLGLLIWLAFKGWSVLLLAPIAAMTAAFREALLAHWTWTFMQSAEGFFAQFFPIFLLGTATFTMSAIPGTPSIQNTIPMPFFRTTPLSW